MEFMSAAILSGITYDLLKHGLSLSADNLKKKLQDWILDGQLYPDMELELSKLHLNDGMSEKAIERHIASSVGLMSMLDQIKPSTQYVSQNHSGSGDNVAGNKIIN